MASLTPEQRRAAALEARNKSIEIDLLKAAGDTVESAKRSEPKPNIPSRNEKSIRPGRPTTANDTTKNVSIRLTPEEVKKIKEWVYLGKASSNSDVVRQALNLLWSQE